MSDFSKNDLLTIEDIFDKNIKFNIPDYQRGYSWQKSQFNDFWSDIESVIKVDRLHYFGMLSLVVSEGNKSKFTTYDVVDGQQRLTTVILLLNALEKSGKLDEDKSKLISDKYLYHFDSLGSKSYYISHGNEESINKCFKELLGENCGSYVSNFYTNNMKEANSYFREKINNSDVEILNKIYDVITSKFIVNVYEVSNDFDVYVAFETMNNRGKKLSNLELLKNRLLYLATFDEDYTQETNNDINQAWKTIYDVLGSDENQILVDDNYLKDHWSMYFTYDRSRANSYSQFLLKEHFIANNFVRADEMPPDELVDNQIDIRVIKDYVKSLDMIAPFWALSYGIDSGRSTNNEKQFIPMLEKINQIGLGQFRTIVVSVLCEHYFGKLNDDQVNKFLKLVERFLFVCFRIGYFNSSYKSSEFIRYSKKLLNTKDVESVFNEICDLLDKSVDGNGESDYKYILDEYKKKMKQLLENRHGFYDWSGLKYALYLYEEYLAKDRINVKIDSDYFKIEEKDKVSIEHILPQTYTNYYWQNEFRDYVENDDEMNKLVNNIGNLLPLSQRMNSSLQNISFDDKKCGVSGRASYDENSCSAIKVAKDYDKWDAYAIRNRSIDILKVVFEHFKLEVSDEYLYDLIDLSFLDDGRVHKPELEKENFVETVPSTYVAHKNIDASKFWKDFINYCNDHDSKVYIPLAIDNDLYYYNYPRYYKFHFYFSLVKGRIELGMYCYNEDYYNEVLSFKDEIETVIGCKLQYGISRAKSVAKRIIITNIIDYNEESNWLSCYEWFYNKLVKLVDFFDNHGFEIKSNAKRRISTEEYLNENKTNQFYDLALKIDSMIKENFEDIESYGITQNGAIYRIMTRNFVGLHIQKSKIYIELRYSNVNDSICERVDDTFGWVLNGRVYITAESQLEDLLTLISNSYDYIRSLKDKNYNSYNTDDIYEYIKGILLEKKNEGYNECELCSGDIHKALKLVSKMPQVCSAMRRFSNIEVVEKPPKGNGSNLRIRYIFK